MEAGMWVASVTMTGNGLGLSQADAESLPETELKQRLNVIEEQFRAAGAHFVLRAATDLLPVLDQINEQLAKT